MRKKRLILTLILGALLLQQGCNWNRGTTVAEVNGKKIFSRDFTQRYRKYLETTSERDNILVRKKVLNNMVNELLIFDDVTRQGFDSDRAYKERMEDIEGQAVLDGYARRLSTDSMTVGEQELWKEFQAYNSKVSARFVYAQSEKEAWGLKERLQRGESFNALAKEVFADPDLANSGGSLGYFGWGEMEPALEEAAYALPVGSLSDPIRMRMGYGIVKVDNRVEKPLASEFDFARVKPKLEETVRQRKAVRYLQSAADRIQQELSPQFNEEAVALLLKNWNSIEEPLRGSSVENPMKTSFQSSMVFVKWKTEQWTAGQFLEKLEKTKKQHRTRVVSSENVKEMAVGLALRSILLDRAKDARLQSDSRVQEQVRSVREDFLLKRWAGSVQDSVGNSGWNDILLREEFEKNKDVYGDPPKVNVAEILLRSEQEASDVAGRIKGGADFAGLARSHSIRIWAARKGGELGFAPQGAFGDFGPKLFKAKIGDVVGPVSVKPYVGFYKVLAFQKPKSKPFKEARGSVIRAMLPQKKQEAFREAVDLLRSRASITLNIENLGNIEVSSN